MMEFIQEQHGLDSGLADFDSWYQDVTSSAFYADDNIFAKQVGGYSQSIKSEGKFRIHMEEMKQTTSFLDACVPEYEANTRSLSCGNMEETITARENTQQHNNTWSNHFSKSFLVAVHNEDSVSQVSSAVPDIVDENETFQDLTELLEQEYPLAKSSSPHSDGGDFHELEVRPSSSITPRSDESQSSLIGSFSVDLTHESPSYSKKGVDNRYKEMRRKNNIASKNARVARREKERQMEERAKQLEEDNQLLRVKVRRMEELAQELKAKLIQSVTRGK